VAIALEIHAVNFVTFDKDQFILAQSAGLVAMTPT
jgi:hypothetical protein